MHQILVTIFAVMLYQKVTSVVDFAWWQVSIPLVLILAMKVTEAFVKDMVKRNYYKNRVPYED